jgi:hypothetical protein
MINIRLFGGRGEKFGANVSGRGEVTVAPIAPNSKYFQLLNVANTAFNFISPKAGKQFVIDGFYVSGDRNVNANTGATVLIYEADSPTNLTPSETVFELDIAKIDRQVATQLNIQTNPGVWINAKTDSTNIKITLFGHFVKVL